METAPLLRDRRRSSPCSLKVSKTASCVHPAWQCTSTRPSPAVTCRLGSCRHAPDTGPCRQTRSCDRRAPGRSPSRPSQAGRSDPARGRCAIQSWISAAIQRTPRGPMRIGRGKSPRAIASYSAERDNAVIASTSGRLSRITGTADLMAAPTRAECDRRTSSQPDRRSRWPSDPRSSRIEATAAVRSAPSPLRVRASVRAAQPLGRREDRPDHA